jgi:hypothetical protein
MNGMMNQGSHLQSKYAKLTAISKNKLPDVTENFAANALFASFSVGHDSFGGRDNCNPNST